VLTELHVRNFQSLQKIDLTLERLTVVVGPSSSGKSALIRALKVLANNSRTSSFITHGAKKTAIRAVCPQGAATYSRDASSAAYSLARADEEPAAYTKLAGSVPEPVRALLGLDTELSFAGQFDKPYLLDSSGAEIAKTLGELTNVSLIFEAAKESNRKKLLANATLKIRQSDFDQILASLGKFVDLKEKLTQQKDLEESLVEIREMATKAMRLRELIDAIEINEASLKLLPDGKDVPDIQETENIYQTLIHFKNLIKDFAEARIGISDADILIDQCSKELSDFEQELHSILVAAGRCPLCGQSTKEV
jgi:exonuclease SbcC